MSLTDKSFEIDILPVGEGACSGDAIAMRVGSPEVADVIVIDGGDLKAGESLVQHIRTNYGNPERIRHVVCTHPDNDHTSGLREVMAAFTVDNLWIHQPWNHAAELLTAFRYGWTEDGLRRHLREDCFPIPAELCEMAEEQGTSLHEPFQGDSIGGFQVLAPSYARYLELVPEMNRTPAPKSASVAGAVAGVFKTLAEAVLSVFETWGLETLKTPSVGSTSAANESSVILFGDFGDKRLIFTGDAGTAALDEAIDYGLSVGLRIISPDFVQMPHHGSRRNVSPEILDQLLGERLPSESDKRRGWAVASAAPEDETHPRKVVLNAFKRRGFSCVSTKGNLINYRHGRFPLRHGMGPIAPEPFHSFVEE